MSPSASTQYRHAASIVLEFDRPFTHLKNLDALSGASPCPVVDTTHTTRRSSDTSIFSYSFMLISVHPAPRPLIAAWIPPATDSAFPVCDPYITIVLPSPSASISLPAPAPSTPAAGSGVSATAAAGGTKAPTLSIVASR